MPEISIIVPTFERPRQVGRAVASALAQDADVEVIVVDDASRAAPALPADPRVALVRLDKNRGPAAARNAGVAAARADWIAFLDSDDAWPPSTLAPRLDLARSAADPSNTIWVAGFADCWPDGRQSPPRIPRPAAQAQTFASGCWSCPGSTALLARSAWERSQGQDERLRRLEDYEWLLRWGRMGGALAVYPHLGALVSRNGRGATADVEAAAKIIRQAHAAASPALRRRIEGYLQLELAASRLHHGPRLAGVSALARSWLMHPRLQASLERFWL